MAFAIYIKDGRYPSNEVCHQLQLKKAFKIAAMHHLLLSLARRSMALAVDVMHGHGPSNEMRTQLQPAKKTKVRPY